MRPGKTILFRIATLIVTFVTLVGVFPSCAGKEPEPDTATGGYETLEKETTPIPAPSYASVYFEVVDYEDLYPWFVLRSETAVLQYELEGSGFAEFAEQIRDGTRDFLIPCLNGEPLPMGKADPHIFLASWYTFFRPWFKFNCSSPDPDIPDKKSGFMVTLTYLTEEEAKLGREVSCSRFLRSVWPTETTVFNYKNDPRFEKAWETTVKVGDREVSLLVKQYKEMEDLNVAFVLDNVFVQMEAIPEAMPVEFFANFSLRPLERPEVSPVTPEPDVIKPIQKNKYLEVGQILDSRTTSRIIKNTLSYGSFSSYLFMYEETDGTIVIVSYDTVGEDDGWMKTFQVEQIFEIPRTVGIPTREAFETIVPGTPFGEVIRLAGIPHGRDSKTNEFFEFTCSDGSVYRVYINERTAEEDGKTVLTGDWYVTWVRKVS